MALKMARWHQRRNQRIRQRLCAAIMRALAAMANQHQRRKWREEMAWRNGINNDGGGGGMAGGMAAWRKRKSGMASAAASAAASGINIGEK
jgi:hypothetical protein